MNESWTMGDITEIFGWKSRQTPRMWVPKYITPSVEYADKPGKMNRFSKWDLYALGLIQRLINFGTHKRIINVAVNRWQTITRTIPVETAHEYKYFVIPQVKFTGQIERDGQLVRKYHRLEQHDFDFSEFNGMEDLEELRIVRVDDIIEEVKRRIQ
jgi:hypothetical protein